MKTKEKQTGKEENAMTLHKNDHIHIAYESMASSMCMCCCCACWNHIALPPENEMSHR